MNDNDDWQETLARMRTPAKTKKHAPRKRDRDLGQEAIMTLVAIMNDETDPKLQIAAAKTLLMRGGPFEADPTPNSTPHSTLPADNMSADEFDAAIALAKQLLEELAARKTAGLDGTGQMDINGATQPDHAD